MGYNTQKWLLFENLPDDLGTIEGQKLEKQK
jgi:hypothetical protein